MENILVGGFNNESAGSGKELVTKIADLEMSTLHSIEKFPDVRQLIEKLVESPSQETISSIAYRSPEVYFSKPWTASTDIWSWGMVVNICLSFMDL